MPRVIRTTDFVEKAKDLKRRGYTKVDIARKLATENGEEKPYSIKLINDALEKGPFRAGEKENVRS